jgi:DNA modification methylase/ParB-like chromosome segregation protein Spo0J
MRTVPLTDLIIPENRPRQEFDEVAIVELANSIAGPAGMLQAIVLRPDARTLVCGERRIRAVLHNHKLGKPMRHNGAVVPPGCIPYTTLDELDPLALEEAELDENFKRRDLTWSELASAQKRLHTLRVNQAAREERVHTVTDTARELLGKSPDTPASEMFLREDIRRNILLADHLDNPVIAKAKSAKEAFKLLTRQEESERHRTLALAVGQTFSAELHQAYHADCLVWMGAYAAGTGPKFDCILTDPPYGMGADQFGDGAGRLTSIEHGYDDSYKNWLKLMGGVTLLPDGRRSERASEGWCSLSYAITKPEAHAYVFCDFDRFHELKGFMEAAGWYVFRTPLINVKVNSGRVPLPEEGPRRQYEICLYAIKGHKRTTAIYSDVIQSEADEQMGHGAQKPVSLYQDLLKRTCRPGDRVLDSFSGSGTIFPAADALQVLAVGVEQSAASYGKGLERLAVLRKAA